MGMWALCSDQTSPRYPIVMVPQSSCCKKKKIIHFLMHVIIFQQKKTVGIDGELFCTWVSMFISTTLESVTCYLHFQKLAGKRTIHCKRTKPNHRMHSTKESQNSYLQQETLLKDFSIFTFYPCIFCRKTQCKIKRKKI